MTGADDATRAAYIAESEWLDASAPGSRELPRPVRRSSRRGSPRQASTHMLKPPVLPSGDDVTSI